MIKKLLDMTLFVYLSVLSIVSVIGLIAIWEVIGDDLLRRAMATLGIISLASIIIIVVTRGLHKNGVGPAVASNEDASLSQ